MTSAPDRFFPWALTASIAEQALLATAALCIVEDTAHVATVCLLSAAVFWGCAILIWPRRPLCRTRTSALFVSFGYLPFFVTCWLLLRVGLKLFPSVNHFDGSVVTSNRQWLFENSPAEEAVERYAKSITPLEELAAFLAIRGMCLREAARLPQAAEAFAAATRLPPACRGYQLMLACLEARSVPGAPPSAPQAEETAANHNSPNL